jgi:uncharacterized protein (DUF1778 family)
MRNVTDNRTEQIGVRLTSAERQALESAAAADQRKISDWARLALLRAAKRRSRRRAA